MKKRYGKIIGIAVVVVVVGICAILAVQKHSQGQTAEVQDAAALTSVKTENEEALPDGTDETTVEKTQTVQTETDDTKKSDTKEMTTEEGTEEGTESTDQQESTPEESVFDLENPVSDENYTAITAYVAKKTMTTKAGLSHADVVITMPQLVMRSVEAGKINAALLDYYTNEFEKGLKGAEENIGYQEDASQEEEPYYYDYSYEMGYEITYLGDKYLSILAVGYEYTGGAHGMPYQTALIFNLETGEKVSGETLFDVSDEDRKQLEIEAYKELFEKSGEGEYWPDALSVVEESEESEYYLTEQGVTFYYYPYALAPYASGFVEVTVPYEKLPLK